MSSLKALKADTHRAFGEYTVVNLIKGMLTLRTFRVLVSMRLCQWASNSTLGKILLPFFIVYHRVNTQLAAMDFSWRREIGPGFAITHGWGLVVSAKTKIGKNVTLFHGVTVGRKVKVLSDGSKETAFPVLEDEVWVGPNAVIVGGVTVGQGSRIAAGAFVTKDIPPYSIVVGNPGKVVKTGCLPDVNNPISDEYCG